MNIEQLQSFAFPVLLVVIFYFLLYRPQKRQQKKRQEMLSAVKVGSRVVTIGGIYGEVLSINEDRIRLKIAENVEIDLSRSAISSNISKEKNDAANAK
ncbi:preprotein translocase subunit YajC [Pectinatus sottacetonis]|uniref:preprotein translocase subunit YajC n=1 Tax=Pectinatus sottacetonis TaxID=1002795 RepID=UPI0018C76080|nr:preprotein translocase subunit YajC [Pectinatus sottacetonis]